MDLRFAQLPRANHADTGPEEFTLFLTVLYEQDSYNILSDGMDPRVLRTTRKWHHEHHHKNHVRSTTGMSWAIHVTFRSPDAHCRDQFFFDMSFNSVSFGVLSWHEQASRRMQNSCADLRLPASTRNLL